MAWGSSLSDINSTSLDDLHEYNSRPTEAVLELVHSKKDENIVFYGATGKWMSDLTEMLLRAILETGTISRKVHIVSRFSRRDEFHKRFDKYKELFIIHEIDLVNMKEGQLNKIPNDALWVIYGLGYKFRTSETDEEYARLCYLYGNDIPRSIISHHKQGADIVVIGSGNGVELTQVDNQAKDDAPLVPKPGNLYGISIRDKEMVIKDVLASGSSKAIILRGGYMTDLTYGGLENAVLDVKQGRIINLEKLTYFNIIGHRDANIYALLAVKSASNPVSTLNLSGHTADIRKIAEITGKVFGKEVRYEGKPQDRHLLLDGSKIEQIYGPPIDYLENLINAQIFWIKNRGYSRRLDHHVGESM